MNFDLMFQPLKKYVDFQGRARRSEYWLFTLFIIVAYCLLMTFSMLTAGNGQPSMIGSLLVGVFGLGMFLPSLGVAIRRLHDTERSGWWLLVGLIPLLGGLALLVFNVLPGTSGPNKYGPDPKAPLGDLATVF